MVFHETRILISVVVPVFNVAPYLRRCVESLLSQTFACYEVILVDDGSTDDSSAICDDYKENEGEDGRIRVIHQANAGVSAARNRGIEAAQGEYIAFVDADDWVEPGFLEAFACEIERNRKEGREADMVVQGYWDHDGKEILWERSDYHTAQDLCSVLFEMEERHLIGYVWNKVLRRQVILDRHIAFDRNIPIGEDAVFAMSFLRHATTMAVSPYVGYHYFYPPGDHKDYSFAAWNKRLDSMAAILTSMSAMPRKVRQQFEAVEFKMGLYVLRVLYHEQHPRTERISFMDTICRRAKGNTEIRLLSYEPSFMATGFLVRHVPHAVSDALLTAIQRLRQTLR